MALTGPEVDYMLPALIAEAEPVDMAPSSGASGSCPSAASTYETRIKAAVEVLNLASSSEELLADQDQRTMLEAFAPAGGCPDPYEPEEEPPRPGGCGSTNNPMASRATLC